MQLRPYGVVVAYKVVPVASLWDPTDDDKKPAAQVQEQLNTAEAKGWRLLAVVPRHKARDDLYADDVDPEGPWLILHRKEKGPKGEASPE